MSSLCQKAPPKSPIKKRKTPQVPSSPEDNCKKPKRNSGKAVISDSEDLGPERSASPTPQRSKRASKPLATVEEVEEVEVEKGKGKEKEKVSEEDEKEFIGTYSSSLSSCLTYSPLSRAPTTKVEVTNLLLLSPNCPNE
jgi:hypothetical protein